MNPSSLASSKWRSCSRTESNKRRKLARRICPVPEDDLSRTSDLCTSAASCAFCSLSLSSCVQSPISQTCKVDDLGYDQDSQMELVLLTCIKILAPYRHSWWWLFCLIWKSTRVSRFSDLTQLDQVKFNLPMWLRQPQEVACLDAQICAQLPLLMKLSFSRKKTHRMLRRQSTYTNCVAGDCCGINCQSESIEACCNSFSQSESIGHQGWPPNGYQLGMYSSEEFVSLRPQRQLAFVEQHHSSVEQCVLASSQGLPQEAHTLLATHSYPWDCSLHAQASHPTVWLLLWLANTLSRGLICISGSQHAIVGRKHIYLITVMTI